MLAILDVLGMTDRRMLAFTDESFGGDDSGAIVFWGQDGETRVCGHISREALDDHLSDGDRLKPDAAFKKHRKEIEALIRREYLRGHREPDGSVLIRSGDIA